MPGRHRLTPLFAAVLALLANAARAQQAPEPPAAAGELPPITVKGHYDNAIGTSDAASQGSINRELLESRPPLRPAELLEYVPGVIVTQHSGDGKANQYFLRGFNLDHGTDFATWVNGMPANMPTHAHGQGYTDLNFVIPELVDRIDYRKGPYFASVGDFGSAGSADIVFRRSLPQPFAQLTLGEHKYFRGVFGGSAALANETTLLGAVELAGYDGPWVNPENLKKANGLLSWSGGSAARGWNVSAMAYGASWDSTDQVPQRAIDAGLISRFGAIDPTDGGESRRYSLSGEWRDRGEAGGLRLAAYAMHYELQLFSNFTFALDRPEQGDQFEQKDDRSIYGLTAARDWNHTLAGRSSRTELGLQARHDRIRVGLFDTVARTRTATTREDRVHQTGLGLYAENSTEWTTWLRSVVGLRADAYWASVDSTLEANSGDSDDTQLSPKLSLVFGPWAKTEFFVNAGRGFHSNDARGTTTTIDPKSGEPTDTVPPFVASKGYELGARTELIPGLQSSLALWKLDIGSELVYVGDAGTTEPNRASERRGVEWNNRWIPVPWLLLDADFAWTHARFSESAPEGDRIPGAVERVGSLAVTLRELGPWSATVQLRYLGPRPLIEDNSVRAGSTTLDQPARRAQVRPGRDADARCLQPVRSRGQRHRILLRVAPAERGRPGGGSPHPSCGAACGAGHAAGEVLRLSSAGGARHWAGRASSRVIQSSSKAFS